MLEKFETRIEDIGAIYSGFPLKENWLQAGTNALMAYEDDLVRTPELRDGAIRFTMAVSYYFTDEELLDLAWDIGLDVETAEEAKTELPDEAETVYGENVTISVRNEEGRLFIDSVNIEYCVLDSERKLSDLEVDPDAVDEDYAVAMVESFLDAAVDAD